MTCAHGRAFGGGKLKGNRIVRIAYIDETGISVNEPVAVVMAAILEPDQHWFEFEGDFMDINKEYVPGWELGKPLFPFSAKLLFFANKKPKSQFFETGQTVLQKLLELPRKHRIPLAFGALKKPNAASGWKESKNAQMAHLMGFGGCISAVDVYMRQRARKNEIGLLIAEDGPTVTEAVRAFRYGLMSADRDRSYGGINRIRDGVYVAKKDEALALQLADVSAFAIRRHLQGAENDWPIRTLLGQEPPDSLRILLGIGRFLIDWSNDGGEPKPLIYPLSSPGEAILKRLAGLPS